MSYDQVKDRTSSAVGTEEDSGALFDETIAAYSARRKRAEEFLSEALVDSHRKIFRAYLSRPQWTTIADDTDSYQLAITPELEEPLRVSLDHGREMGQAADCDQVLKRDFDFLCRALGTAAFRRVWRVALEKLNALLWNDVLMSNKFTTSGASQFIQDVRAITALIERYIPDGSSSLGSLCEALQLLNLPIEAKEENMTSLREVADLVFTDNAEAKSVLDRLEIDMLTPANARQILQHRVEIAE